LRAARRAHLTVCTCAEEGRWAKRAPQARTLTSKRVKEQKRRGEEEKMRAVGALHARVARAIVTMRVCCDGVAAASAHLQLQHFYWWHPLFEGHFQKHTEY
jgi:hypothetical protein